MRQCSKPRVAVAALLIISALAGGYTFAQDNLPSKPRIVGGSEGLSGDDCHTTILELDDASLAAYKAGGDTSIILIARLGKGEKSRKLVHERLRQLVHHMTENRSFPKERVITAEDESVRGLGQVEVYVGGKLYIILKVKRGKDFATGCVPVG